MQLATRPNEPDQKMSPSIYAALVDSLFQNSWPMFAGALCAAVAAVMTARQDRQRMAVAMRALIIVIGAVRAFEMRQIQDSARRDLTAEQAEALGDSLPVGAMLYAAALGAVVFRRGVGQRRCGRAHDLLSRHDCATSAAGGGRNYGRPWIFQCADSAGLRAAVAGAGAAWRSLLHRAWRAAACCSSSASSASSTSLQRFSSRR